MCCLLVSHFHWDREWYRSFQAYRARLVDAVGAVDKVKELLTGRGTPEIGLRVGVRGGGCSGNSYFMEFCESQSPK